MLQTWLGEGNVVVKLLKCAGDPLSCLAEESHRQEEGQTTRMKKCEIKIETWAGKALETKSKPVRFPINSDSFFN